MNIKLIIISTFYIIYVLFFSLIFILYSYSSNNYYMQQRRPFYILLLGLSILIFDITDIFIINYKNISHLLKFNISYICMNIVILISDFRGISEYLIYLDNKSKFNPSVYKYNYKKILNFIYYLFILIFILSLLYILIISFLYKNIYFNEANWQYFPLFIECIIHYFFIYPFIIIKLYKNSNIIFKNDYIITYIFAIPSFIVFELYTFFFPKNINIGIYIKCFFDFLCYNGYCIFPFIDVIKYKNKINKRLSLLVNENIKDFEDNNLHYKFIKDYYNLILQKQNVNNIFNINKILENKFDEKKNWK